MSFVAQPHRMASVSVAVLVLLLLCGECAPTPVVPHVSSSSSTASNGDHRSSSSSSSSSSSTATNGDRRSSSSSSSSSTGHGGIVGDPLFSGLRGQQYQVHGIDGAVYNLISDSQLQLNSEFVFLTGPRPCPRMPSHPQQRSAACFVHDGSYLSNLALRTNMDDRLLVEAGDAKGGFQSVEVNGLPLAVGESETLRFADHSTGSVHRTSTHELHIVAGLYQVDVDNSDAFLNLRSVAIRNGDWAAIKREAPHGLLGQTWQLRRKGEGVIEGRVDDYQIQDDNVIGDSFLMNKFALAD